jgi:hypothetical protein
MDPAINPRVTHENIKLLKQGPGTLNILDIVLGLVPISPRTQGPVICRHRDVDRLPNLHTLMPPRRCPREDADARDFFNALTVRRP